MAHRVIVSTEARIWNKGGQWFTQSAGRALPFWQRYLAAFDRVVVLARVGAPQSTAYRVDGPEVEVVPINWQHGVPGRRIFKEIRRALSQDDSLVIVRAPGPFATLVTRAARKVGVPYAMEIVGDPKDAFSSEASRVPFSGVLGALMTRSMVRAIQGAKGVAYVTENALQKRYPPPRGVPTSSYSSVEIAPEEISKSPRRFPKSGQVALISVTSFRHLYKAPDVVIEAFAQAKKQGVASRLTLVGEGPMLQSMEKLAENLGVRGDVIFCGFLGDRGQLLAQLDAHDVFVLPSRQEGLPRAMIEAMARALPCIGSRVGGIPELLPEHWLAASPVEVAACLAKLCQSVETYEEASRQNLQTARSYERSILQNRRSKFYSKIRSIAEVQS